MRGGEGTHPAGFYADNPCGAFLSYIDPQCHIHMWILLLLDQMPLSISCHTSGNSEQNSCRSSSNSSHTMPSIQEARVHVNMPRDSFSMAGTRKVLGSLLE